MFQNEFQWKFEQDNMIFLTFWYVQSLRWLHDWLNRLKKYVHCAAVDAFLFSIEIRVAKKSGGYRFNQFEFSILYRLYWLWCSINIIMSNVHLIHIRSTTCVGVCVCRCKTSRNEKWDPIRMSLTLFVCNKRLIETQSTAGKKIQRRLFSLRVKMKTVFSPFEFIFIHYFLFKEQLGVIRMEIKNDQWEGEWSRKNMLFFHFICVIMCNTVF